ncbi:MAG: diaminopimelate epimerase [Polyangiales bacterium]
MDGTRVSRSTVDFWKYEGTANDFVLLEGEASAVDLDPREVARICDRHRGIGADGVLLVTAVKGGAAARMVVRNADGSRPEMCGNGLRCVALHVCTRLGSASSITVETDSGPRLCKVTMGRDEEGLVDWFVTIDMGRVVVGETRRLRVGDRDLSVTEVDAGNPHAVTFDALEDDELDELGARLQTHELFPRGVNLERVRFPAAMIGDENPTLRASSNGHRPQTVGKSSPHAVPTAVPISVEVAVYERGVGRTLACGTGACAVAAALVTRKEAMINRPIEVVLEGGTLQITVDDAFGVSMRGGVRRVFAGRISLNEKAWRRD